MPFCCLHPRSCFTNFLLLTSKTPIYMSGKLGAFSKQNGICTRHLFMMRIVYIKLQSDSLCYRQTKWYMQKMPCVKTINMYVIGLILPSVLKTAKHIRLYPATHYCTRLKGVKERIIQRSLGIFYFLIVMLRHFTLLYYLNPLMPGGNKSMC